MVKWKTITIDKDGTLHQFKYTTDDLEIEKGLKWAKIWKKEKKKKGELDDKSKFKNLWKDMTREELIKIKNFSPDWFKRWINEIDNVDTMSPEDFDTFYESLKSVFEDIGGAYDEEVASPGGFTPAATTPYFSDADSSDSAEFGMSTPPKKEPQGESKTRRKVRPKKAAERREEMEDAFQAAAEGRAAEGALFFEGGFKKKRRKKTRKKKKKKKRRRKSRKKAGHYLLGGGI